MTFIPDPTYIKPGDVIKLLKDFKIPEGTFLKDSVLKVNKRDSNKFGTCLWLLDYNNQLLFITERDIQYIEKYTSPTCKRCGAPDIVFFDDCCRDCDSALAQCEGNSAVLICFILFSTIACIGGAIWWIAMKYVE